MKDFNRGKGNRFGGPTRPSMYPAVCSECGRDCEVPFRPIGDKPIYCRDCFSKKKGFSDNRQPSAPVNHDQYKQQFELLNNKLDNILRLLTVKPALEKMTEKAVKAEAPVIKVDKKKADKKVEAKKVAAPKKVAKKAVAKKKK